MTETTETTEDVGKTCRICLDTEYTADNDLIAPCKCAGTSKYVHRSCLDTWRTNPDRPRAFYACSTCTTKYVLRKAFISSSEEADERRRRRKMIALVIRDTLFVIALFCTFIASTAIFMLQFDEFTAECVRDNSTCAIPIPAPAWKPCKLTCPYIRNEWAPRSLSVISAYALMTILIVLAFVGIGAVVIALYTGGGGGGGGSSSCPTGMNAWTCLLSWAVVGAIVVVYSTYGFVKDATVHHTKTLKLRVLADDYVVVDFDEGPDVEAGT